MAISAKLEKIAAIRGLREYCENCYGVCPGLKETKDFVDSFAEASHTAFIYREALKNAPTDDLLEELRRRGVYPDN